MDSQMVLMRLENKTATTSNLNENTPNPRSSSTGIGIDALLNYTGQARWDLNNPFQVAVLEPKGVLQTYILETTEAGSKACLYPWSTFQLHISYPSYSRASASGTEQQGQTKIRNDGIPGLCLGSHAESGKTDPDLVPRPIEKPWGSFDFIPKHPDEIVFFHAGSSQILFAQLPRGPSRSLYISDGGRSTTIPSPSTSGRVYCVGRHSSSIFAMAVRPDGLALASAGKDGFVRIWWIFDGSLLAQFKFSGWGQPRCSNTHHPQNVGVSLSRDLVTLSREKKIMHFLGGSGDLIMGCPSGEMRFWSASMQKDSGASSLSMKHSGSIFSGKDEIASLALHVSMGSIPAFPFRHMNRRSGGSSSGGELEELRNGTTSLQDLIAVGTNKGIVQVWTLHNFFREWVLRWSRSCLDDLALRNARKTEASISCLSFRADGKLLAVAVSNSNIYESEDPSSRKERWCCNDFLVLYETSTWRALQTLNFPSQLGSCCFYRPHFETEKECGGNCASSVREKIASCRLLLVSTSIGPQVHILPEYGLFQQDSGGCEEREELRDRRSAWTRENPKRIKNLAEDLEEPSVAADDGEGDGTGNCETRPSQKMSGSHRHRSLIQFGSQLDSCYFCSHDDGRLSHGKSCGRLSHGKNRGRLSHGNYCGECISDRCGVIDPPCIDPRSTSGNIKPVPCIEPFERGEPNKRRNCRESSGVHLRRSKWDVGLQGLRKVKFHKTNDETQRHTTESAKSSSPSIHHLPATNGAEFDLTLDCERHHEIERKPQPRSEQKNENPTFEKLQNRKPSSPNFEQKNENYLDNRLQNQKSLFHGSSKDGQKIRSNEQAQQICLESKNEDFDENLGNKNPSVHRNSSRESEPAIAKVVYKKCTKSTKSLTSCDNADGDIKKQNARVGGSLYPNIGQEIKNQKTTVEKSLYHRKEDHFMKSSKNSPKTCSKNPSKNHSPNPNVRNGNSNHTSSGFGDRLSNSEVTFLNPKKRGGKENIDQTAPRGGKQPKRFNSKYKQPIKNHHQRPRQSQKNPNLGRDGDTKTTAPPAPAPIGGDDLEELLLMNELKLPLIKTMRVGNTFKNKLNAASTHLNANDFYQIKPTLKGPISTATEDDALEVGDDEVGAKSSYMLNYPKLFSTASLMQKVHEIEKEQFDVETAIKVAKKKGILLNKEEVEELKAALEEEEEENAGGGAEDLRGKEKLERPSSRRRYNFPLMKISDPRLAHPGGPLLGAAAPSRKTKRNVESSSRTTGRGGAREDLRTIQPDLLDLWDPRERCPQVCSSAHVDWRTSRSCGANFDRIEDLAWAQREENWRAISSAQAVYQNCLYGSHLEPTCNCTGRPL